MNQAYFEKWSELTKKAQEPFQAMTKLNLETMQKFNYLKPDDLSRLKKPDEFLEKQLGLVMNNVHTTLDYMQKSFQIFENVVGELLVTVKENTEIKK